jgi:hypothetical protein
MSIQAILDVINFLFILIDAIQKNKEEIVNVLLTDPNFRLKVDPSANVNLAINSRAAYFDLHRRCKVFNGHQKMVIQK